MFDPLIAETLADHVAGIGDAVHLNTGGPTMTVVGKCDEGLRCVAFDGLAKHELVAHPMALHVLIHCERPAKRLDAIYEELRWIVSRIPAKGGKVPPQVDFQNADFLRGMQAACELFKQGYWKTHPVADDAAKFDKQIAAMQEWLEAIQKNTEAVGGSHAGA